MKQYIVLISMIVLGVFLYTLIAGPGEGSMAQVSGEIIRMRAGG